MLFISCFLFLAVIVVAPFGGGGSKVCGSCGPSSNLPCPADYQGIYCPPPCGRCGDTRDQPCEDPAAFFCDLTETPNPSERMCGQCGPNRNLDCPPGYTQSTCPRPCGRCGLTFDQPCEVGELWCPDNSLAACPPGQYEEDSECVDCSTIDKCLAVNCLSANLTRCSECEPDYMLSASPQVLGVQVYNDRCVSQITIPCRTGGCRYNSREFQLIVPAAAIRDDVSLVATAVTSEKQIDFANTMVEELQSAITMGPAGLTFSREVTICLPAEWDQSGRTLTLMHTTDDGGSWSDLTSLTWNPTTGFVCGNTSSFSSFVAASRVTPLVAAEDSTSILAGVIGGVSVVIVTMIIVQFVSKKTKGRVDEMDLDVSDKEEEEEEGEEGEEEGRYDKEEEAFSTEGGAPSLSQPMDIEGEPGEV